MNSYQHDVLAFQQIVCKKKWPTSPGFRNTDFRIKLIDEEADELSQAVIDGDFPEAIKELCDLLYVVIGTACEWGIDLDPFWKAVHESNMKKAGAERRDDGKIIKPKDWQAPRIEEILEQQKEQA